MPTSTVFCTKSECFGTEKYDNAVNCPQNPMRCGTLDFKKAKSKGVRRWGHCPRGNERLCSFEAYFIILKDRCQLYFICIALYFPKRLREKSAVEKIFPARVQLRRIFSEKRLHLAHKIAFQKASIAAICTKIKNYPKTP